MKYTYQRGYTLIDLLMYIAIVGSLLIAVTMFAALSTESRVKNQSVSEVNSQGSAAMDYMTQAVRNADTISAPVAGATASSLTVTVPTSSLSPTIFDLSGGALRVKEGTAAAIALTNSKVQISALNFKNLTRPSTPGIVQISFVVSRTNPNGKNEYDYQKTFTSSIALRWP